MSQKTISAKRLLKLNPSVKTLAHANKILYDYKHQPKAVLIININNIKQGGF